MTLDVIAPRGYAPTGKDTGVVKPKGTSKIRAHDGLETIDIRSRKPSWLKVRSPGGPNYLRLKRMMRSEGLHTVCEEAGCPNIGECWEAGTATFMILGDVCTRACKYCGVAHGMPTEFDLDEPRRVAQTVAEMELEHVVITSVNRDELPDGGAGIYAETIRRIHAAVPGCSVEVLIPDFKGDEDALETVVDAKPAILGHNLETVLRLHPDVRPGGRYWRSISYLGAVKRLDPGMLTKTSIILGMGEEPDEIRQAMADLREAAVDVLTLGQYLRPSPMHIPVARWVTPDEFATMEARRRGGVRVPARRVRTARALQLSRQGAGARGGGRRARGDSDRDGGGPRRSRGSPTGARPARARPTDPRVDGSLTWPKRRRSPRGARRRRMC